MSPHRNRRLVRAGAALALLPVVGTLNRQGPTPSPPFDHQATIRFDRVVLDPSAPARRQVGALIWLDGWSLASTNAEFGGISAMHVEASRVTALTDGGRIIRFRVPLGQVGELVGRIDPLIEAEAAPIMKEARDTEALAVAGSLAWVGYERRNAIMRYRTNDWHRLAFTRPRAMHHWPRNGGGEALVQLRDGRFLIFSERARRAEGTTELLLFDGDPALPETRSVALGYRGPPGYVVTDAAELPDGRLLILNRRLRWGGGISAKLLLARLPGSDGILEGSEVASLRAPLAVDNMEGLSVTREGGRTIVWIVSDDNFSPPLQRTLLMKFALAN